MQATQIFILLSHLFGVLFSKTANGDSCEDGFFQYDSKCFRIVKANATYESAKYICAKVYKGELLRFSSEAEKDLLVSLANTVHGVTNGLWIANSVTTGSSKLCPSLVFNGGSGSQEQECNNKNSFICEKKSNQEKEVSKSLESVDTTLDDKFKSLEARIAKIEKALTKVEESNDDLKSICQPAGGDTESRKGKQVTNEDATENNEVTIKREENSTLEYQVKCAAPPLIIQTPKEGKLQVEEGEAINLNCRAFGYPKPTIGWNIPSYISEDLVTMEDEKLAIQSSKSSQSGLYSCWANNNVGNHAVKMFDVEILHSPKVTTNQSVIHTGTGQRLNLSCVVESNPDSNISWIKRSTNETLEQTAFLKLNKTFVESKLEVLVINSAQDLGVYTCYANNTYGNSSSNITLVGAAPFDVQIKNATEVDINKFKLVLSATSYCGIDSYKLKFKSNEDSFWMETLIPSNTLVAPFKETYNESLDFPTVIGKRYKVILFAKNEFGWTQSPEFEFNSSYVCGVSMLTAKDHWRYIVSHEFYGKYNVPRDYQCETNIGSDGGLLIEFLDIDINTYEEYQRYDKNRHSYYDHDRYGYRTVHGQDITVNVDSVSSIRPITGKVLEHFSTDSSFTLNLKAERGTSKGFKARFKKP